MIILSIPKTEGSAGKILRVDTFLFALQRRVDRKRVADGPSVKTDTSFGPQETDFVDSEMES